MDVQEQFVADVTQAIIADPRIAGAWLEGSLGRGDADRFSDVDLHLLVTPAHVEGWREGMDAWLRVLRPLVLYRLMFDGAMANALTTDGLRIDLWTHVGETYPVDEPRVRVIHAKPGALTPKAQPPPPDPAAVAARLQEQIAEFWRCVAMLPVVLGRRELIVAHMGLTVEQGILVNVLLDGYEVARDAGVKKLNPFLPLDLRQGIEGALDMPGLTLQALAGAHLALAAMMQEHGPVIAARHGFVYPSDLEACALAYVQRELA